MIVANGSIDMIIRKVNLPITIDGVTRVFDVRVANRYLDTELILRVECQNKFDMSFLSRTKKAFMPDP